MCFLPVFHPKMQANGRGCGNPTGFRKKKWKFDRFTPLLFPAKCSTIMQEAFQYPTHLGRLCFFAGGPFLSIFETIGQKSAGEVSFSGAFAYQMDFNSVHSSKVRM